MFEIIPETQIRQKDYKRKDGKLEKKVKVQSHAGCRQNKCNLNMRRVGAESFQVPLNHLRYQGPVSRKPRKLFGPVKSWQNLEPYDYRADLFTYS